MLCYKKYHKGATDVPVWVGLVAVFGICVLGCGGCFVGSKIETSNGFRDSTVRKISESGIIFKTWEVETLGDGLRGDKNKLETETFRYSVMDPTVIAHLKDMPSTKRVRVHYKKKMTVWSPSGESNYFITKVEELP